jgi:hypothetical protein
VVTLASALALHAAHRTGEAALSLPTAR